MKLFSYPLQLTRKVFEDNNKKQQNNQPIYTTPHKPYFENLLLSPDP